MEKLKVYAPWVIALMALFSAVWSFYHPRIVEMNGKPVYRNVTKFVTKTVPVKCPNGTIQGTGVVFEIPSQDVQEPILATGSVPASQGGFDLTTSISASTGEATIWAKPVPRRLLGFEDSKEVGLRYSGTVAELFGRWSFVRIGSFYGGLYAEVATDHHTFAGVEVSYRF